LIGPVKLGVTVVVFLIIYSMMSINGQSSVHDVIKTRNSDRFVVDYDASNNYRRYTLIYNL